MNRENALRRVAARIGVPAVLATALMTGETGHAADLPPPAPAVLVLPTPASGWKCQISFYGWARSLAGEIGVGNLPMSSVNMSFSDVLKHLNGALMGSLFARNGDWLLLADVVLAKLSDSRDVGAVFDEVDVALNEKFSATL